MCLSNHLSGYEITLISLQRAIKDDDAARIKMLDPVVSPEFETILAYKPDTADEMRILVDFLLKQLIPQGERSQLQTAIVEKLSSLFEQAIK